MLELRVQANSFDEDKDKPNASVFDFTMAYSCEFKTEKCSLQGCQGYLEIFLQLSLTIYYGMVVRM